MTDDHLLLADCHSDSDLQRGRAAERGDNSRSAAYNASFSPDREEKPISNVNQYSIPRKPGGGAGMLDHHMTSKTSPTRPE